jgi:hypothetical protein
MYTYCSIIQKYISPTSNIFFNDDSFHKKNISEIIFEIHNNLLNNECLKKNILELNQLNLYYLLAKMVIFYKNSPNETTYNFIIEKYNYLNSIFENIFFNDTNKQMFLSNFSKIQKIYFTLSKFARMYKYKKASVKINTDLYMNDLNENMKNVFVLYEDGSKYLFSTTDLVNIMNSNLSHTYMYFSDPLKPKNPYNNLPFNKSTLYNIYFFMKNSTFIMPQLFEQYFICNFDIKLFKYENECLIRDFSIKRYIYSSNYDTLYDNVLDMIDDLKKQNRKYRHFINIDDEFPHQKLVDIMRPYLHLYYLSKYYVSGTEKKNESMDKLNVKFDLFVRFNPHFGRKIIKIEKIPKKKMTIEYNDKHMNFYKKYPKSAFPKLPVVVSVERNNYEPAVSSYENLFNTSIFQRLVNRISERRGVVNRTENNNIFSSSSEEDVEEEENVEEDNNNNSDFVFNFEEEIEEDISDDTDSTS